MVQYTVLSVAQTIQCLKVGHIQDEMEHIWKDGVLA